MICSDTFLQKITALPEGSSAVFYKERKYEISKEVFNEGKSMKLYAEEAGGKNFISCNLYYIKDSWILKPCEIPAGKVVSFVEDLIVKDSSK